MQHCAYNTETGLFVGVEVWASEPINLAANTPPGCALIKGQHDHLSKRVDLATGEVVDWQPPKPADTDLETYAWDATSDPKRPRWRATPTALARKQRRQGAIAQQMDALEAKQARPLRELALDPTNAAARTRLADIETQLAQLRALHANPPEEP